MADILKFTDTAIIDESIEEYEYHEYEPIMDFLFFNDKSVIKQGQLYVFMVKEYNSSAINVFVEKVECHFLKAPPFSNLTMV